MSIDRLQERIRKSRNPVILELSFLLEHIPPHIRRERDEVEATIAYCRELLCAMKEQVCAVRFSFGQFAMLGEKGLRGLAELLCLGRELGYYLLMDGGEILSPWAAERAAKTFFAHEGQFSCDALVISPYIGTDAIKPFLPFCAEGENAVFFALRTANKSAADLQDLLTGSRHVHNAAADLVSRFGDTLPGKSGYSGLGGLVSATAPAVVADLRRKYNRMFLLVDGCDYPGGNVKNCAGAFDRFGHGAAVCVGTSVAGAWYIAETDGTDFAEQAVQAVQRIKKNITRYVTIV